MTELKTVRAPGKVGAARGLVVPPRQRLGKRPAEDLAEVPRLPDRQVLDQAEEVGPGGGQGTADVVLAEPVELPDQRLAHPAQLVVKVLFRDFIDHGHPSLVGLAVLDGVSGNSRAAPVVFSSRSYPPVL
jgi:hypothetical protein